MTGLLWKIVCIGIIVSAPHGYILTIVFLFGQTSCESSALSLPNLTMQLVGEVYTDHFTFEPLDEAEFQGSACSVPYFMGQQAGRQHT